MSTPSSSDGKSESDSNSNSNSNSNGWSKARGVVLKSLLLIGGAILLKQFTKSTTRWDHARNVAQSLAGEKVFSLMLMILCCPVFLTKISYVSCFAMLI